MSLTPEQIAELRGQAGLSPTPPPEGVNNVVIRLHLLLLVLQVVNN